MMFLGPNHVAPSALWLKLAWSVASLLFCIHAFERGVLAGILVSGVLCDSSGSVPGRLRLLCQGV